MRYDEIYEKEIELRELGKAHSFVIDKLFYIRVSEQEVGGTKIFYATVDEFPELMAQGKNFMDTYHKLCGIIARKKGW